MGEKRSKCSERERDRGERESNQEREKSRARFGGERESDRELFQNMNTRVPSEPILLLTHEFEKLSIY